MSRSRRFEVDLLRLLDRIDSGDLSASDPASCREYLAYLESSLPVVSPEDLCLATRISELRRRLEGPSSCGDADPLSKGILLETTKELRERLFEDEGGAGDSFVDRQTSRREDEKKVGLVKKMELDVRRRESEVLESRGVEEEVEFQQEIENDMLENAAMLKENVQRIHDALKADAAVVEEAHFAEEESLSRLKSANENLKSHMANLFKSCFSTLFLVLLVSIVFVSMFLFMRLVPKPKLKSV